MLGVGGGEHGVSKLHVRKFVSGESGDFAGRVEILADYERRPVYDEASNGVNCLGVNGVELASQKCRVNDYHNVLYYCCFSYRMKSGLPGLSSLCRTYHSERLLSTRLFPFSQSPSEQQGTFC